MNDILKNIDKYFPSWKDLDQETKILNYIEFCLYLVEPRRWSIRVSSNILGCQDKLDKINDIATELSEGKNIWHRLSLSTIKSYINLPKTIKKREKIKNKVYGKDLLQLLFNIHHIRIDKIKSDKKENLFDTEINFVEQKQNELLFTMFDDRYSTVYFLDVLKHDDLYQYYEILNIINKEPFPKPYYSIPSLPPSEGEGFTNDEIKKLLFKGSSVPLTIQNSVITLPINMMTTSGFTDKTIKIYQEIIHNNYDIAVPSDFFYLGQIFSEFYQISFKQF